MLYYLGHTQFAHVEEMESMSWWPFFTDIQRKGTNSNCFCFCILWNINCRIEERLWEKFSKNQIMFKFFKSCGTLGFFSWKEIVNYLPVLSGKCVFTNVSNSYNFKVFSFVDKRVDIRKKYYSMLFLIFLQDKDNWCLF